MRDLPPIAGAIIWARQIERQLLAYMKRAEDVLGKGWELYAEGQKLQSESAAFRQKLDVRLVYDAWLQDIKRCDMAVNGRLFEIVRLCGGRFHLAVNFDPQTITLFKEVRNLLWLGFQVPRINTNMAKDAKQVYPHAMSLVETIRAYGQTLDLVQKKSGDQVPCCRVSERGTTDGRERRRRTGQPTYPVHAGIRERSVVLQDKTNNVINLYGNILRAVDDLATCDCDRSPQLGASLEHWVTKLDQRIEGILF
ncbi:hypothetical protein ID866_9648 [Astraeus odoratus]|nr:hypothetical protein ID866_9648 [Astraeus odoratus]